MRRLKLQVQISVDGFIGGPNGEMDWMTWNWDDALKHYVDALTDSVDTILLGKNMADGFVSHWKNVADNPQDPGYAFGKKMIHYPKLLFSKTLTKTALLNTTLVKGDVKEHICALKKTNGRDMIVYGGAGLNSSLIQQGLIDDYFLFVNPAAIGRGLAIFSTLPATQQLNLVKATGFDCGITVLHYQPITG